MKRYKAIFLDWDDTIGDWTNAEHLALRDIYTTYHLDHLYASFDDYLAAYKPYNLELWGKYGYRPLLIQDEPELCGQRKDELSHRIGDEFLRLTNTYFRLMPDADRVVRYLASKYPLTIVSNGFKEVQYYKFEHSGLSDCLTHTLVSDEIGINKPQPEIFRIALERNGVKADEAIMIGDSYSSDIAGAKAAGIDQIWLHEGETSETATFIVPRLTDIMNIL